MWCYQKPGFESLLLAELQRQQQCSQFCDTLLKAGGVSVPAHSCVLSAISPHISSALSSSSTPPNGQRRLLEFQALGSCTLLHIVRLLYSGEMAGEGENEKREAICAAAKLGISGLVEVTRSRGRLGGGTEQQAEAEVQTEDDGGGLGNWRKEVKDGFTYLWKETVSGRRRDMWTQTEEELVNFLPPPHPVVAYETIDMNALQNLGQTDSHQFVPVTLVYPPAENQMLQPPSGFTSCLQEASGSTSVATVAPQHMLPQNLPPETPSSVGASQSCLADLNPNEWEQFDGNITGFIDYFLIPEKKENTCRGRAGIRPSGARGGQQRTRTPTERTGRRGRGGLTQKVGTQEIGVSKVQKVFLERWTMRMPRTGRGGGTVGRKLCQKTREELESASKGRRRRGRKTVFEVGQSPNLQRGGDGGTAKPQRGRRPPPQQLSALDTVAGQHYFQLLDSGTVGTEKFPPPASLPHEEQPEGIESLLEEVMMGLDILPNKKATHPQHPFPTSGETLSSSEVPMLQQQSEGELNDVLENFLQLFDHHADISNPRKEKEKGGKDGKKPRRVLQTSRSQTPRVPRDNYELNGAIFPEEPNKEIVEPKSRRRGKSNTYLFSLEKRGGKRKTSSQDPKAATAEGQRDRQLQQIPVVKLKRSRLIAVRATLQGDGCHSASEKCPSEAQTASEKNSPYYCSEKNPVFKSYPIRSRFREAKIKDLTPLLEQNPLMEVDQSRGSRRSRLRKNGNLPASSHVDRTTLVQPQSQRSCCTDERKKQRRHEGDVKEEEETPERGRKCEAEPVKEIGDEVHVDKRVCLDRTIARETSTASSESAAAALEQDEVIDVETVSLSSFPDCLQEPKQKEEPLSEDESLSAEDSESGDSIIDVEGDSAEDWSEKKIGLLF